MLSVAVFAVLFSALASSTTGETDCAGHVSSVLSRNSPEFVLLPAPDPDAEFNTFATTRVRVHVDWSHIHNMLKDSGCVKSYMVEHRPFKYYNSRYVSRLSKRESVAGSSQISPPMEASASAASAGYTLTLPDDCSVYAVQLVVITSTVGRSSPDLFRSLSRRFWPSGRRTTVERFSDGVVLTFPPSCAHMTDGWRMQSCRTNGDDCDIRNGMTETLESNESPLHVSKLAPCTSYSLRLLSPMVSSGASGDSGVPGAAVGQLQQEDLLWSFEGVKTLPRPEFDVKAGHDWLKLRISQAGCESAAVVDHWRITRCQHEPKKRQEKSLPPVETEYDSSEEEGSGGHDDTEAGDYYYYEDPSSTASSRGPSCVNSQHDLGPASSDGLIELSGLTECTLYSLDITPTASGGETLQPGEQYGTIHSTLCRAAGDQEEDWFGEQEDSRRGPSSSSHAPSSRHPDGSRRLPGYSDSMTTTARETPPPTTADLVPYYLLLAAGALLFAVLGLFGLWLGCFYLGGMVGGRRSGHRRGRQAEDKGGGGCLKDQAAGLDEASNLTEDGVMTSSPNVALLTATPTKT